MGAFWRRQGAILQEPVAEPTDLQWLKLHRIFASKP